MYIIQTLANIFHLKEGIPSSFFKKIISSLTKEKIEEHVGSGFWWPVFEYQLH